MAYEPGDLFKRNNSVRGWPNFGALDSGNCRAETGLSASEPLEFTFTLKIPISVFSFHTEDPFIKTTLPPCCNLGFGCNFVRDAFANIEDPGNKLSDAKLIPHGGDRVFYCHKMVIGWHSEPLEAMLRHPPANGASPGEYPFPTMDADTLKKFIEFLYIGQTNIGDLSTTAAMIELAHNAERYGLNRLKEACGSALGKRVAEEPEDIFSIIRFADLMDGMKYLKHHAMDVLFENWETFKNDATVLQLYNRFGVGNQGDRLRMEYDSFRDQRLKASF